MAFEFPNDGDMKIFLEVEFGPDKCPIPPPDIADEDILIFFKLYDPKKEELRYVGRLFVKISCTPAEILSKLNDMAGFAPDEELQLFEELAYRPGLICNPIDEKASFQASKLEDGDIICFQKFIADESREQYRCPDVRSFFFYLQNRHTVHFRSLARPREDEFSLELLKMHTYDDIVAKLSDRIGLNDPSRIRLTGHNWASQQPRPCAFIYQAPGTLFNMLVQYNQLTDILYYEVLDIPLPELHQSKVLDIHFYKATKNEVISHKIRIPKHETVADLLFEVGTRVQLTDPDTELRLLGIHQHRILKIFPPNLTIEMLNDREYSLRVEEIPEEEKIISPGDRLLHVYHFMEPKQNQVQSVQNFGEPFIFVIHGGETIAQVKPRIQKKLQVPDEEFSKWKFASVLYGRPRYLQDADIVSEVFQRKTVYGDWEHYLGLEHVDDTPKKACTPNNPNRSFDRAFKIYN